MRVLVGPCTTPSIRTPPTKKWAVWAHFFGCADWTAIRLFGREYSVFQRRCKVFPHPRRGRLCPRIAAHEAQIGGPAARRNGLLLVAGRRPIGPAHAPVGGTPGAPAELRMGGQPLEDPSEIVGIVGCDTEFGARGQHARQGIEEGRHDQAALVM